MKSFITVVAAALLAASAALASEPRAAFRHLTPEQGLSHPSVYGVAQDRTGFIWFTTQDGVSRYDGYRFRVFQHDSHDPASLAENDVSAMIVDDDGSLWFGTWGGGLDHYDPRSETFDHFRASARDAGTLRDDRIQTLMRDHAGNLWVGTFSGGVSRLARGTRTFSTYLRSDDPRSLSDNRVWSLAEDSEGSVWIGTENGLNRFDARSGTIERIAIDHAGAGGEGHSIIRCLFFDNGTLWIGMQTGLDRFDVRTRSVRSFRHDERDEHSVSSDAISAVLRDHRGTLWVATKDRGLNRFDERSGTFVRYTHDPAHTESISADDVRALHEDRSNNLWIATRGGGVDKLDLKEAKFRPYIVEETDPAALHGMRVQALYEDRNGALWIGTTEELHRLDSDAPAFTRFRHDPANPRSIPARAVQAIAEDRAGNLWLGFWSGGYCRFDPKTAQCVEHYGHDPNALHQSSSDTVTAMLTGSNGVLWIASNRGLKRFDPQSRSETLFRHDPTRPGTLSDDYVTALFEDQEGVLWVGTDNGGLDRFDPKRQAFDRLLPDAIGHRIRSIEPDGGGGLWLATTQGLDHVDPRTKSLRHYGEREGLAGSHVEGLLRDSRGNLWLSTYRGISRFDIRTGRFRNYAADDGGIHFDTNAHFRGRDGRLYFGGTRGFIVIAPDRVRENAYVPPVVISGFRKFNTPVAYPASFFSTSPLELSRHDNFFSFEFAALDFTAQAHNEYAYKLEGLDRDWVYAGHRPEASYTNVPPGRYVFRVRGSNNDGVWNEAGTAVSVIVTPAFWQTLWFRILAIAALLGAALAIYRARIVAIESKKRELELLVAERTNDLQKKTTELERVSSIIRSINAEIDFDRLQELILGILRTDVDQATALVFDPLSGLFRLRAALGWDARELEDVAMTLEQAEAKYLAPAREVFPDLYLVETSPLRSTLIVRLNVAGRVEGFLIFEKRQGATETVSDLALMAELKEPILSAFQKARALQDLERLNESKNEFVGIAAHDLRTPLGAIAGWVTLVIDRLAADNFDRQLVLHQLKLVRHAAEQMEKLIRDLLDISAIESGKIELDRRNEDLRAIVDAGIDSQRAAADRKEIRLIVERPHTLPAVSIDPTRIGEVVDNLLSNAVKYTQSGGEVRASFEVADGEVITHVRDNGQGLNEDDLKTIFRTFKKLSARPTGGESSTGLGLAIVKKLVEIHGGRVWVTSERGKGSTFSFALPRAGEAAQVAVELRAVV